MKRDELVAICAMNKIFGYKPKLGLDLMDSFGSASEVFAADRDHLRKVTGPCPEYLSYISQKTLDETERELEEIEKAGSRFIPVGDPHYPELLRDCADPPLGLYLRSDDPQNVAFNGRPSVAIVGTRDVSQYGKEICIAIVKALARAKRKSVIVSGLALGTDITAHLAALDCGLPTIAVMATGIDEVYPKRHEYYADQIAHAPMSGLVTDYPPHTPPLAPRFMRRNRIIAGLCQATILIESRVKGGGMLTAGYASGYDRELYAVPGRMDDARSQGCNWLIASQKAEAVFDPEKLVDSLGLGSRKKFGKKDLVTKAREHYSEFLPEEECTELTKVLSFIREEPESDYQTICSALGIEYSRVAYLAGLLEADGFITSDLLSQCCIKTDFS